MKQNSAELPYVIVPRVFLPGQTGQLTVVFEGEDAPGYRLLSDCHRQKKSVVLIVPQGISKTRYYAFGAVVMLQDMSPAQIVAGEKVQFTFKAIGRYQFLGFVTGPESWQLARVIILPVPDIDEAAWQSQDMRALRGDILKSFKDVVESYSALPWDEISKAAETDDDLRESVDILKKFILRTQSVMANLAKLKSDPHHSYAKYHRLVMVRWMAGVRDDYKGYFLRANDVKEQLTEILFVLDSLLDDLDEIDDAFQAIISTMSSGEPLINKNLPAGLDITGKPPQKKSNKDLLADLLAKLEILDKRLVAILGKIARKGGDDSHE
ncbi:MAG: hypothetical protein AAB378_02335 [Patescibacteria group bacterium]